MKHYVGFHTPQWHTQIWITRPLPSLVHKNCKGFSCIYIDESCVRTLYLTSCKIRNYFFKKYMLMLFSWGKQGLEIRKDLLSLPLQHSFWWAIYKTKSQTKHEHQKYNTIFLCDGNGHDYCKCSHKKEEGDGDGCSDRKIYDLVQDPVRLEG